MLASNGHSDMVLGHVSARDPGDRGVWMKAWGLGFEEVTERDVILVGWEGEVLAGEGRRHREFPIHTEVMRAHAAVGGVVHTHPPHATAFAASGRAFDPISHVNGVFATGVPIYRDALALVETPHAGARLARAIAGHRALLLAGHGIVTSGTQVGTAVAAAVMLERACKLQLIADGFGGVADWLAAEDIADAYMHARSDEHLDEMWRYLVRTSDGLSRARR